jgi:hypothetical protein
VLIENSATTGLVAMSRSCLVLKLLEFLKGLSLCLQNLVQKHVDEFKTYIERNSGSLVNYGERYRAGERISTGFTESAANYVVNKRFSKRQQMQ